MSNRTTVLVSPWSMLRNTFIGFITNNETFECRTFYVNWDTKSIFGQRIELEKLESVRPLIEQRLKQTSNPQEFFSECALILGHQQLTGGNLMSIDTSLVRRVHSELENVKQQTSIKSVDYLKGKIEFIIGRDINLVIEFDSKYPRTKPRRSCSLPLLSPAASNSCDFSTILSTFNAYLTAAEQYECARSVFEVLDGTVMTSTIPDNLLSRKLYSKCSSIVQVDIAGNTVPPMLTFFGPDSETGRLRSSWERNKCQWYRLPYFSLVIRAAHYRTEILTRSSRSYQNGKSYLSELEKCLETKFRIKRKFDTCASESSSEKAVNNTTDTNNEDDEEVLCPICYVAFEKKCEQEGSQIVCGTCKKKYHDECMRDWCTSCPNFRVSFGYIFGICPNCESQITINPNKNKNKNKNRR